MATEQETTSKQSKVHYHDGVACHHDHGPTIETVKNPHKNIGRNDPCHCGSGKKFKKCCLA